MSITRDDLYHMYGPMLAEAIALITKDEINILRQQHGLPPRTNQQLLDAIEAKLASLPPYPWLTTTP